MKKVKFKICPVADKISEQNFIYIGYELNKKDIKYISDTLIDLLVNGSKT